MKKGAECGIGKVYFGPSYVSSVELQKQLFAVGVSGFFKVKGVCRKRTPHELIKISQLYFLFTVCKSDLMSNCFFRKNLGRHDFGRGDFGAT